MTTPLEIDRRPFEPTADATERIWAGVDRRAATSPSPRQPRLRRLVIPAIAAVAIVAGVALAPDWDGSDRDTITGPRTASAALLAAGAGAADEAWTPLSRGGYHHVFSVPFDPKIKRLYDAGPEPAGLMTLGIHANEVWFDANGRGLRITLWGGTGDADVLPDIGRPDRNGERRGFGYHGEAMSREIVDVEASLRIADGITTWRWMPDDDRPVETMWGRTADGYVRMFSDPGSPMVVANLRAAERSQVQHWGDTLERFTRLDSLEGAELEAAIFDLLDTDPVDNSMNQGFPTIGQMGITKASRAEERRIERAVELLGTAPLAPAARRAIFEWLAERPSARTTGRDTDEFGRNGTRVTFETRHEADVAARTVTIDDLVAQDRSINTIVPEPVPDIGPWQVPDHTEQRRWYVSILFDPQSGQLLEHAQRSEVNTTEALPWLEGTSRGPLDDLQPTWNITWRPLRHAFEHGTIYLARERTTEIEPMAEACQRQAGICGT